MSQTTSPSPSGTDPDGAAVDRSDQGPDAPAHASAGHGHGSLDLVARRVLGLRDAEPRALVDLEGSLVLSAVRCILTYVLIPVLLPAIAWAGVVARPLGLALAIAAVGMSIRSLRRVWQANWTYRWPYTVFIAVVVGLLAFSIVLDVRFFLN